MLGLRKSSIMINGGLNMHTNFCLCIMLLMLFEAIENALATTGNVIDDCWMGNSNWNENRMRLADCVVGFGRNALGGKGGNIYVVTDSGDDPVKPWKGTLRYGAVQKEPLWIIFQNDMRIKLKAELIITSFKTIDGRGANVQLGFGSPCITIQFVTNVIIHGLTLHDCTPSQPQRVISSTTHTGRRGQSDGDAIDIFGSSNIWIDHNSFARSSDGLVDIIRSSTDITVSNNYYSNHNKVMLFGHSDSYTLDRGMRVTVLYNHFGPKLTQRMPRVRYGIVHVVNNFYEGWGKSAIGGSSSPTILSEGNRFEALNEKAVTKYEGVGGDGLWRSNGDMFLNGAFFIQRGSGNVNLGYSSSQSFIVKPASWVLTMTARAGPLFCRQGRAC